MAATLPWDCPAENAELLFPIQINARFLKCAGIADCDSRTNGGGGVLLGEKDVRIDRFAWEHHYHLEMNQRF